MRLLPDENLPKRLKPDCPEHEVFTIRERGWNGIKNGDLLKLMHLNAFDALLTFDKNLQHQQNFKKYTLAVFVLTAEINRYNVLTHLSSKVLYRIKIGYRLCGFIDMGQRKYADQIKESSSELYALERKAGAAIVRDRLRFLRLLKSRQADNPPQAGAAVNFHRAWSYQLWNRYVQKGLPALSDYPFKGTKPRLDELKSESLKTFLSYDNVACLDDAAGWIKDNFNISYTRGGMSYVMKRLGIKKKTGRPSHIRKEEEKVEAFKKKRLR